MQQEFRLADILLGGLWVGVLTLFCLPIMEMTVKKVTMERDELVKKLEEVHDRAGDVRSEREVFGDWGAGGGVEGRRSAARWILLNRGNWTALYGWK
jgi:hypothetical protein